MVFNANYPPRKLIFVNIKSNVYSGGYDVGLGLGQ